MADATVPNAGYGAAGLKFELGLIEAVGLLGTLQLALRHPEFKKRPTGKWIKTFAEQLEHAIVEKDHSLAMVCAAGWLKKFDA